MGRLPDRHEPSCQPCHDVSFLSWDYVVETTITKPASKSLTPKAQDNFWQLYNSACTEYHMGFFFAQSVEYGQSPGHQLHSLVRLRDGARHPAIDRREHILNLRISTWELLAIILALTLGSWFLVLGPVAALRQSDSTCGSGVLHPIERKGLTH